MTSFGAAAEPPGLDVSVVDPARRYNDLLGGKDSFAVDRASAEGIKHEFPAIAVAARENRKFLLRAVRFLAAERGIRQFLDVGVGVPMSPNVHEVAQEVDPTCRVVYVDHSPLVAAHARALLVSSPEGKVAFAEEDLRRPDTILTSPHLAGTLDMREPVALILAAVLHFCTDQDDPYTAVSTLIEALPSDSYVIVSHATFDPLDDETRTRLTTLAASTATHGPFQARTRDEIAKFLDGLDLEPPGLVSTVAWHPETELAATGEETQAISYALVGRVP